MQTTKTRRLSRNVLLTTLLPLTAGGAQAGIGSYSGYIGSRQGSSFAPARQMVVVDPQVEDYQSLLAALPDDIEVVLLSGTGDGVREMADALAGRDNLEAVHILSHGEAGRVLLGEAELSSATLEAHGEALRIISGALSTKGDLLFYGCNVAEGETGRAFIDELAVLTGADLAASDDPTGSAKLGGNWVLEYRTGELASRTLFDQNVDFSGLLGITGPTTITFDGAGTQGQTMGAANPVDGLLFYSFQWGEFGGVSYVYSYDSGTTATNNPATTGTLVRSVDGRFALNSIELTNFLSGDAILEIFGYNDGTYVTGARASIAIDHMGTDTLDVGGAFGAIDEFRITSSVAPGVGEYSYAFMIDTLVVDAAANMAPTGIGLSNTSVNQSAGTNSVVGTLTTTDPDPGDTHTYSLVSGVGGCNGADNGAFNISSDTLRANDAGAMDADDYAICIRTTDQGGLSYEKGFTISVIDDVPPVFQNSTPTVSGTTATGTDLTVRLNETGTAYYVVVPGGADAPSAAQVRAGQNASGGTPVTSGTVAITTAGTDFSTAISGLEYHTAYDIHVVAEDAVPNLQTSVAKVEVTTLKAVPSVSEWPLASVITYGEALSASTLSGGSASVPGSFAFSEPDAQLDAGTHNVAVTFTPTDPGYSTVDGTVSVTVDKATATVTLGSLSTTYDGTAKAATATTDPEGLTVTFTYDGDATAPTAVGTYTVVATVDEANYTGSATDTLTIAKAVPNIHAWPTASVITYGDELSASTLSGGDASVTGSFAFSDPGTQLAAGTHEVAVVFTPTDSDNYNSVTNTVSVTVNQATPNVTAWPTASTITYGEPLSAATLSGGSGSVDGSFAFSDPDALLDAGTHSSVAVTFTPTDPNYSTVDGTVSVTVEKATATVTLGSLSATYDGSAKAATATTDPEGLNVTFTYDGEASAPTNAGTYTVVATVEEANYSGSLTDTLTIAQATPEVTEWPTASAITYGDRLSASTLTGGSSPMAGTFAFDNPETELDAGTHDSVAVIFTPDDTANYTIATGSVSVTVAQATPEVAEWPTASLAYGEPLSAATLTGGEASVDGTFVFEDPTATPEPGTHTMAARFEPTDATNYTPVSGTVSVTVSAAVATPTFSPAGGIYQEAQSVTITTATDGASLEYRVNSGAWQPYSMPVEIPLDSSVTLEARARKTDWDDSTVASGTWHVYEALTLSDEAGDPLPAALEMASGDEGQLQVRGGEGSDYSSQLLHPDGSYSTPTLHCDGGLCTVGFTLPEEGAFAGTYTLTVTDTVTGLQESINIEVPLALALERQQLLSLDPERHMAEVLVRGAIAGSRVMLTTDDATAGVLLTPEDGVEASEDYGDANPARFTVALPDDWEEVRAITLVASFGTLPDGEAEIHAHPAQTYLGRVHNSIGEWLMGVEAQLWHTLDDSMPQPLLDEHGQSYQSVSDGSGEFELFVPPSKAGEVYTIQLVADGYAVNSVDAASCQEGDACQVLMDYAEQTAAPSFSVPSGEYRGEVTVVLKSTTEGAQIRYTLDGSTPTPQHGVLIESGYTLVLEHDSTLKAIAFKDGMSPSDVVEASYTVREPSGGGGALWALFGVFFLGLYRRLLPRYKR